MSEEIAERSLRQAGYRVYLPRYRKEMKPHGSDRAGKPSMRPLFVGYIFVHDWHGWPLDPITGIVGLMKSAGRNVELADEDLARIWAKEKLGSFDELPTPRAKQGRRTDLPIGGTVEFDLHGERVLAVLDELSDSGKAIVRGLMFNRETVLSIPAETLRVVAS